MAESSCLLSDIPMKIRQRSKAIRRMWNCAKRFCSRWELSSKRREEEISFRFSDHSFDIVTNRHGDYDAAELQRVLKPGGLFLTQQVGAENDRELVELLLPQLTEVPYPKQYLEVKKAELLEHGFEILESGEVRRPIRFFDVGALVWFARIIEWEFPGFSVESCFEHLLEAQKSIERDGLLEGSIHRFYIVAKKK